MGINTKQLIELIIQPTLKVLNLYSIAAEQLLAGTCAQESGMGTYLAQYPSGIAKGIFQMEDASHDDVHNNFLRYHPDLLQLLYPACGMEWRNIGTLPATPILIYNFRYACAMARIHYLRVKEKLPAYNDLPALAAYWKKYYNTTNGAGTESQFIDNFNRYVKPYYQGK